MGLTALLGHSPAFAQQCVTNPPASAYSLPCPTQSYDPSGVPLPLPSHSSRADRVGGVWAVPYDTARTICKANIDPRLQEKWDQVLENIADELWGDMAKTNNCDPDLPGLVGNFVTSINAAYLEFMTLTQALKAGGMLLNAPNAANPYANELIVPDPHPSGTFPGAQALHMADDTLAQGKDFEEKTRNWLSERLEHMVRIYIAGTDQLKRDFGASATRIWPKIRGLYQGYRPNMLYMSLPSPDGTKPGNVSTMEGRPDPQWGCDPSSGSTQSGIANVHNGLNRWFKGSNNAYSNENVVSSSGAYTISNHQCPAFSVQGAPDHALARGRIVDSMMLLMNKMKDDIKTHGKVLPPSAFGASDTQCRMEKALIDAYRTRVREIRTQIKSSATTAVNYKDCAENFGETIAKRTQAMAGKNPENYGLLIRSCLVTAMQTQVEAAMVIRYTYCVWKSASDEMIERILNQLVQKVDNSCGPALPWVSAGIPIPWALMVIFSMFFLTGCPRKTTTCGSSYDVRMKIGPFSRMLKAGNRFYADPVGGIHVDNNKAAGWVPICDYKCENHRITLVELSNQVRGYIPQLKTAAEQRAALLWLQQAPGQFQQSLQRCQNTQFTVVESTRARAEKSNERTANEACTCPDPFMIVPPFNPDHPIHPADDADDAQAPYGCEKTGTCQGERGPQVSQTSTPTPLPSGKGGVGTTIPYPASTPISGPQPVPNPLNSGRLPRAGASSDSVGGTLEGGNQAQALSNMNNHNDSPSTLTRMQGEALGKAELSAPGGDQGSRSFGNSGSAATSNSMSGLGSGGLSQGEVTGAAAGSGVTGPGEGGVSDSNGDSVAMLGSGGGPASAGQGGSGTGKNGVFGGFGGGLSGRDPAGLEPAKRVSFGEGSGAGSGIPVMGSADPDDYFTRIGLEESLFKRVERVHVKTAAKWELEVRKARAKPLTN